MVAILFEPYVERLGELEQLDALKDLANVYRSLRKWDKVDEIARVMKAKAEIQYTWKHQQKDIEHNDTVMKLSRPMFVYMSYADLLCASVCDAQGDYQQALQYTYAYADLDWVKETDENTLYWVKMYQDWARCNIYVNKLLSGDISALPDYVEYIADTANTMESEKLSKLLNVMIAANQYNLDVDDILSRFKLDIDAMTQLSTSTDMYSQQVVPDNNAWFGYEMAYYYLNRDNYSDGFKQLLFAMVKSHIINNETYFINCIGLFMRFQVHATPEIKTEFSNLIEKVWIGNVEKNGTVNCSE